MRPIEQIERVTELMRINPEEMNNDELNEACAHLLFNSLEEVKSRSFSPTTNADDALLIMTKVEMVLGSHGISDSGDEDFKPEPWYSAHSFISGTDYDSGKDDIKEVICVSAAKYLKKILSFHPAWNVEKSSNNVARKP
jgi:hypothetical protein